MLISPKLLAEMRELESMSKKCGNAEETLAYHRSLKENPEVWMALELKGYQKIGDGLHLEMRDCARCGSTLSIKVKI